MPPPPMRSASRRVGGREGGGGSQNMSGKKEGSTTATTSSTSTTTTTTTWKQGTLFSFFTAAAGPRKNPHNGDDKASRTRVEDANATIQLPVVPNATSHTLMNGRGKDSGKENLHRGKGDEQQQQPPPPLRSTTIPQGSRVGIYWNQDEKYYAAVVQRIRRAPTPGSWLHLVRYEQDDETEWLDLARQQVLFPYADNPADETNVVSAPPPPRRRRTIVDRNDEDDDKDKDDDEQEEEDSHGHSDESSEFQLQDSVEGDNDEQDEQWMITDDDYEGDDKPSPKSSSSQGKRKALGIHHTRTPTKKGKLVTTSRRGSSRALKVTHHPPPTNEDNNNSNNIIPSHSRTPLNSKASTNTNLQLYGHVPQVTPKVREEDSPRNESSPPLRPPPASSSSTLTPQRPPPPTPQMGSSTTIKSITATVISPSLTGPPPPQPFIKDALNPAGAHVHNHLRFLQQPKDAQGRTRDHPDYDPRTLQVDEREWTKITGKAMTDAVQQWWELKARYFDTVLFFKTGKFYELYHMDADIGVQVLHLTYMKGHVAHAGFPEVSYGAMADQLVRAGYKVARVEQTETPAMLQERKQKRIKGVTPPKVVNREVCSIVTLGTRTFCYLDDVTNIAATIPGNDRTNNATGPLLAIREVLLRADADANSCHDTTSHPAASTTTRDDNNNNNNNNNSTNTVPAIPAAVCEYGFTMVDAIRGVVTIGQFADDVLRSRLQTLLATYHPTEVLIHSDASPTLQSLLSRYPHSLRVEKVQSEESFPRSTALDARVRREMDRGEGTGREFCTKVHPWNSSDTIQELHRRKYYPASSKNIAPDRDDRTSGISRWPPVLKAAIEGNAELAISSFGACLYYLQRHLIDAELLSMGIVEAYIPPTSGPLWCKHPGDMTETMTHSLTTKASSSSNFALTDSMEENIDHMALDGTTLRNLEILTNSVDYKVQGSLWHKINFTKTPHGARLLRAWLLRPLFRPSEIHRRADAVQELVSGAAAVALQEASTLLAQCGDIERLLSRVHSMSGKTCHDEGDDDATAGIHPNDRAIMYESATYTQRKVGDFSRLLQGLRKASLIPEIFQGIPIDSGLLRKITSLTSEGGCFPDMTAELDWFFQNFDCQMAAKGLFEPSRGIDESYDKACEEIEDILASLEDYKREVCSILRPVSLAKTTWKYINTKPDSKDKYLIELPANIHVPDDFIIKGKRGSGSKQVNKYRTKEVQDMVDKLERAIDVQKDRKARGMQLIFAKFDASRNLWAAAAQTTALLDALGSLAHVASKPGYSRPKILDCPADRSPVISIRQGRHPCVENTVGGLEFVPNDLLLGGSTAGGADPRVLLLSGPNMGGKSTLLRQTCLIAILAQMGSFVPAEACELTPIDSIYTRLGASDRLLLGQSTFFVELAETAAALRGATRRSLVIMDELGRGTSTFDGTAIASATVKHLVEHNQCLTLFATHYHTLLDEWMCAESVRLGHMECIVASCDDGSSDSDGRITFLYTLGQGVCPKSFGINVARLAGLPDIVLSNAKRISDEFELEVSGSGKTGRTVTARNASFLKRKILEALEGNDWLEVNRFWKKLRNS